MIIPARSFARFKARQARGGAWMQIILNLGIITANVALFYDWFAQFGISLRALLVIGIIGYFVLTIGIGYLDERSNMWSYENEYHSNLNPVMMDIRNGVIKIANEMNKENQK